MEINLNFVKSPEIVTDKIILGGNRPFVLIAGPCVLEPGDSGQNINNSICLELNKIRKELNLQCIFKASFDKANRSSLSSFRGFTIEDSFKEFIRIKETFDLPLITDIHEIAQIQSVSSIVDVLQIPAFLCRQTDLILAAAKTNKLVHVKKGQFVSPHDIAPLIEKFKSSGNNKIFICDRGYTFGYNRYINDMGGLHEMRSFGIPISFDVTHSVQEPGASKDKSGGHPQEIPALARAAVAVGIDALFMEVHPEPEKALSDASTVFPLDKLRTLINQLHAIDNLVKKF